MSDCERLMRQITAYSFALWELHIFLDTHPNDCNAAKKQEEYRKKYQELVAQDEAAYGPIHESSSDTSRWAWVSGPWPWETDFGEGNC